MTRLEDMLIRHEDLRLKPYRDTVGKLTIGVGRNLDDVGISEDEALLLLDSDIQKAKQGAASFPWFPSLDEVRQDVVIDMIFNMGLTRFSGFKNMIAAIARQDYVAASEEMMKSTWATQVGQRSIELSAMMKTGSY